MAEKVTSPQSFDKIIFTLDNCLLPKTKLKETPSQRDGLSREAEIDLRILGCELIQTAGILLKLRQITMATGQVLFQRFYYAKSFVNYNMEATAMSCIYLASKLDETPRQILDVINVFHHMKQVRGQKIISPMILDQSYVALKTKVINAERRVLKELGFCVHIRNPPHKILLVYLKLLGLEINQKLVQCSWNCMNDLLRTDVFVRYQPETIACACIYLAAMKLNLPLPNKPAWYEIFKVTKDDITDICYRISELYRRSKPNAEELEQAVDKLKKTYMEFRNKGRTDQNIPATSSVTTSPATTPPITTPPVTTPPATTVDRNNGSYNAFGGFICRTVPVNNEKKPSTTEKRTRFCSVSESPSRTRKHRSGSRTSSKYIKSKSRHNSKSPSSSPQNKHKKLCRENRSTNSCYKSSSRLTYSRDGHARFRSVSESPSRTRKHRSRSRTSSTYSKTKSRNNSKSPSSSPQNKHKKLCRESRYTNSYYKSSSRLTYSRDGHARFRSVSESPSRTRKHRSRSRTSSKYSKTKSINNSKSPSSSPQNKHKKLGRENRYTNNYYKSSSRLIYSRDGHARFCSVYESPSRTRKHRSRSRTSSIYSKTKSTNNSKSPSSSPQNKHKKLCRENRYTNSYYKSSSRLIYSRDGHARDGYALDGYARDGYARDGYARDESHFNEYRRSVKHQERHREGRTKYR